MSGTPIADANLAASNRFGLPVCNGSGSRTQTCVNASGVVAFHGFTYAECESGRKQPAQARRDCRAERSEAPYKGAYSSNAPDAEFIEQHANRKLAQHVCPVVGAGKIAKGNIRDSERRIERFMRDGKIDSIEVIDQDAETEQPCDSPAAPWDLFATAELRICQLLPRVNNDGIGIRRL